jgi:hypothetical protein
MAALPLFAAEPEPGDRKDEASSVQKERLAAMKRMASRYEVAAGKEGETKLQLTAASAAMEQSRARQQRWLSLSIHR